MTSAEWGGPGLACSPPYGERISSAERGGVRRMTNTVDGCNTSWSYSSLVEAWRCDCNNPFSRLVHWRLNDELASCRPFSQCCKLSSTKKSSPPRHGMKASNLIISEPQQFMNTQYAPIPTMQLSVSLSSICISHTTNTGGILTVDVAINQLLLVFNMSSYFKYSTSRALISLFHGLILAQFDSH